ncbi:MAG: HAMP domain-containing methyl-accepting chemotaxis protein [Pseudomonadota bacterium]
MAALFKKIGITAKIYTGFGGVIALMTILALVSYFGLEGNIRTFSDYRSLARDTNLIGTLQSDLLLTRLGVRDFMIRGDQDSIDLVERRLTEAEKHQAEAATVITDPARARGVEVIGEKLKDYHNAFRAVTEIQTRRNEALGVMNEIGPLFRARVTKVSEAAFQDRDPTSIFWASRALEKFLAARLYARKFLVSNETELADRASLEFSDAGTALATLMRGVRDPESRRAADEAKTNLQTYVKAFDRLVTHTKERNALVQNSLDVIGPQIAETVESVKAGVTSVQDTLGPQAVARIKTNELIVSVLAIGSIAIALLFAFGISRMISVPIRAMVGAMQALADGKLETTVPALDHRDEVGSMAKAVQVFKDNAIERRRLEGQTAEEANARAERQKRIDDLINGFQTEVEGLLSSVADNMASMQNTAEGLTQIADRTAEEARGAASASEEASGNVQTVASASEELGASIQEISQHVVRAMEVVSTATHSAQSTNQQVASLAEAARKIGDVVNLISDIAEQTNLLALNATIEAARAGEAGRGFAVVASEVKQLAEQTAKATDEISSQISGIQSSTSDAATAIEGIAATMDEVNTFTTNIATAVEEQEAATREISRNAQEAASGTSNVSRSVTGVNDAVDQTRNSAAEMRQVSATTTESSESLKTAVGRFLTSVAAA